MDFRICPTCNQSVLDDEAEDCPFCGASMSGKPSATATAPSKPAASTKPVKKEADAKAATAKKAAPKKTEPEDDPDADPFDIKSEVKQKKLFLMRVKAVPGCRVPVKCPMCGVEGYIPEKQCGKEVKCRDSSCLVPVFTAPMPEKKEVVEEKPKGLSANAIVGISLAAAIAIAAGFGYSVYNSEGDDFELQQGPETSQNNNQQDENNNRKEDDSPLKGGVKSQNQVAEITVDEMKTEFFSGEFPLVVSVAQQGKARKPEKRQIAAVAYALMADEKRMRDQLAGLERVLKSTGSQTSFMKARPLTALGWAYLKKGKTAEAKKVFDEALALSKSLPNTGGTSTVSTAVQLAALGVKLGDFDSARQLAKKFESSEQNRIQDAKLVTATKNKTFDYALEARLTGNRSPKYPISSAVARVLVTVGDLSSANQWCSSLESAEEKAECLSAIVAEVAITTANQMEFDWKAAVESAMTEDTAPFHGFAYSRLALAFAATKQAENAMAAHQLALSELQKTEDFPAAGNINLVSVHRGSFRVPTSTAMAAESYAALAEASYLVNDSETGWEMTFKAVNLAQRAMPPLRVLDAMVKELNTNQRSVDRQLRNQLNLSNDNQVRREFSNYRRNLTSKKDRVDQIEELQADALLFAAENGQEESVLGVVKTRDSSAGTDWAPLLNSDFSGSFREILKENGKDDLLNSLEQIMGRRSFKGPEGVWIAERRARRLLNDDQDKEGDRSKDAYGVLVKNRVRDQQLKEIILKIGCELASKGEYIKAAKWSVIQTETQAKEHLMRLLAGHAFRHEKAGEYWTELRTSALTLTEKGMVCLGLAQAIDW